MKAFEIHTYQGGRWKIDSIFDDKGLALFEARRMEESFRFPSIRVVEEEFNETRNETVTKTIFRSGKVNRRLNVQEEAPKKAQQQVKSGSKGRARNGKGRKSKEKKKSGIWGPVIALVVLIIAGLAAIVALEIQKIG
jgi:hypothetical protein